MNGRDVPQGSATYAQFDSSSCHGAFADSSAAPDSLASLIKNAVWVPSDIELDQEEPVQDRGAEESKPG